MRTTAAVASLLIGASAATPNDDKMVLITEGILKGALDAEGFSDIASCIKDGETLVSDAEAAYKDFEGHSPSEILDGLKKVADAFKVIKAGMSDCSHLKADWARLEAMATNFRSPTAFAYHVAKDLAVNGVDIYHELSTAVGDYKDQEWLGFGENVGMAAAKVLLGGEQAKQDAMIALKSEDQRKKMAGVTAGVLNEFGGKFNLWELLGCIQYEDQAAIALTIGVESLETAAGEFKTNKKQAVSDAFGGLIAIFAAFQQGKQGLPICENVISKVEQLDELKRVTEVLRKPFDHFSLLEDDIQVNGYSIMYDIEVALAAYHNEDYDQFGHIMGKIMKLATAIEADDSKFILQAPSPASQIKRTEITEVVQGFLDGAQVGKFNFLNLLICINNADQAAEILYQDVSVFDEAVKDKDFMEGVEGAVILLAFVQQLKQQVIPSCESVDKTKFTWDKYDQMIETVEDPEHHLAVVEKNIMLNGVTITKELNSAMADFKQQKYHNFGFKIAQALVSATEVEDKNLFLY